MPGLGGEPQARSFAFLFLGFCVARRGGLAKRREAEFNSAKRVFSCVFPFFSTRLAAGGPDEGVSPCVVFPFFFRSIPCRSVSPGATFNLDLEKRSGPRPFFWVFFQCRAGTLECRAGAFGSEVPSGHSAERALGCRAGTLDLE